MRYFLRTYATFRQHKILPSAQTQGDEAAWWMRCMRVMDDELAKIEQERTEAHEREMKRRK